MAKKTLEKWLLVPDTHRPYHDKRAVNLLLQVAKAGDFDGVAILGDYGDFYPVSSHAKNPNRRRGLEWEIEDINVGLDEFDAIGFKKKIFVMGNHEDRLERYLMDKAPELFNMVKCRELFKLDERGWKYVPYKTHTKVGRLHITHDTGKAGQYAHYAALNDFQSNVAIGHTHRLGYTVCGNAKGRPHVAAMFGWLGDVNEVDYMHKISALRNWALGFGVAYVDLTNKNTHVMPVPIIDYSVVFEGKLYKA